MLKNIIEKEKQIESIGATVTFVVMVAMTSINVFSRYLFGKSFPFAEEVAYLMFAWCVFIGACDAYRTKGMVAVDVFVDRMPASVQRVIGIFVDLLLIAVNAVLAYLSIKICISGWARRTPSLAIPYTFMYLPVAISFTIMAITSVNAFIHTFKAKACGGNDDE